jgi:hypothetical protein
MKATNAQSNVAKCRFREALRRVSAILEKKATHPRE